MADPEDGKVSFVLTGIYWIVYWLICAIVPIAISSIAGKWCFYLVDSGQTLVKYVISMTIGFSTGVFSSQSIGIIFHRKDLGALMADGCMSLFYGGTVGIISSGLMVYDLMN